MEGNIKLLVMDADGTLTDGRIYMGENGEAFKAFHVKDGCGIKDILPKYGIVPVVITARESRMLKCRCKELGITQLYQGEHDKKRRLEKIMEENLMKVDYGSVAYIGDDILDLQCMVPIHEAGGIVGCPADAVKEVKDISDFVSSKNGGDGAVREFIEFLVYGRGSGQNSRRKDKGYGKEGI